MARKRRTRPVEDEAEVMPEDGFEDGSEDDSKDESENPQEDKSQQDSQQKSSEEEDTKTAKRSIGSHCEPSAVIKAAKCLSAEAKDVVKDCGFGSMLEIKVTRLQSIETAMVMMDKCDVSSDDECFTIVVSEEKQIKVTSKVVERIFGIPAGDSLIVDKNWSNEYYNFWKMLKDNGYNVVNQVNARGKVTENKILRISELIRYIESVEDKHEQACAFFCIVLCKLLIPTQSNVPTPQHVGMCSYIDSMREYNWCRYVCQDLKKKITAWQQREKTPSKIEGCLLLLLKLLSRNLGWKKLLSSNLGWNKHRLIHSSNAVMTKKIDNLVKNIKDTMNVRQEVAKYKPKPQPSKVKKPASRKQQVARRTGKEKQPASENQQVTGQHIVIEIPSVQDLLKESEVDKGEEDILLKEINSRIESGQAMLMQEIEKIKNLQLQNNEDLKKIVAEHSILSKLYNEIKYRAQIEDDKIKALMRENVVIQINDIKMMEDVFVKIFKPGGHLHNDVVEALRFIWNKSWDNQIMLSMGAVIFVPFCIDSHWSLIVVEPDIEVITVLDSYNELEDSTQRHEQLINALKAHLSPLGLQSANYDITTAVVQKQNNLDDCGFHMLLYIMRYKDGNYKNISEDEVLMCHKRIARFLLEHEDNMFRGAFTNRQSKRMLEDEDARTKKKQKVTFYQQTKKKQKKDGEKSNEDQEDKDEEHEKNGENPFEDPDKDGGTSDEDKDGGKDKGGKKQSKKTNKRTLEGRSVKEALKVLARTKMVSTGDCSASPFQKKDTWTQNLGDKELQLQLWNKIVGNEAFKSVIFLSLRNVVRVTDGWKLSGNDIFKSFGMKTCCEDTVVSFYIRCLIADEVHHGRDTVGYRIFLNPKIAELLLAPKEEYNDNSVVVELKQQYNDQQILKARHIFLPVCYKSHWTVYVINKNYEQIDVLDSMCCTVDEKRRYHQSIAGNIRTKLSYVISLIVNECFSFSDWSMPVIRSASISQQEKESFDSGFFVMMYLKHYNPDTRQLEFCDLKNEDLRRKILWYLLHHDLNASADSLPEGIINLGSHHGS